MFLCVFMTLGRAERWKLILGVHLQSCLLMKRPWAEHGNTDSMETVWARATESLRTKQWKNNKTDDKKRCWRKLYNEKVKRGMESPALYKVGVATEISFTEVWKPGHGEKVSGQHKEQEYWRLICVDTLVSVPMFLFSIQVLVQCKYFIFRVLVR